MAKNSSGSLMDMDKIQGQKTTDGPSIPYDEANILRNGILPNLKQVFPSNDLTLDKLYNSTVH